MSDLIKSKERVSEHGEVFTPIPVVKKMLNLIVDEWVDPEAVFLEPTCGNGNFIIEILKKRLENKIPFRRACNTLFGMDIMADNIRECHERIYTLAQQELEAANLSKADYWNAVLGIICVVENNITVVKDSLVELDNEKGSSAFENKKFFGKDPSGNNQTISPEEQEKIKDKIKSKLKQFNKYKKEIKNLKEEVFSLKKEEERLTKMDTKEPALAIDLLSYTHPLSPELAETKEKIAKLINKGNRIREKYNNDPLWVFFRGNK